MKQNVLITVAGASALIVLYGIQRGDLTIVATYFLGMAAAAVLKLDR